MGTLELRIFAMRGNVYLLVYIYYASILCEIPGIAIGVHDSEKVG